MLDVLIIGAGPIGLACGIEAQKAGLKYLIVEKGVLVNSLYNYPSNMTFFSTSEKLEIGEVPFISHLPKPTRSEALEYYRRAAMSWKLKIHLYEKVENIEKRTNIFYIHTSKGKYTAKNIVVATGFYDIPNLMNIPGEDLPKVRHYYTEPHPYFGQKIAVIGAANSAVDVALETYRKGADVTMVVLEEAILSRVKYWVRPDIENRIKEGSIKAHFNSKVTAIHPKHIEIETPDGTIEIENDFVLAMTGYKPNFAFLEMLGVEFQTNEYQTPHYDEETQESNVAGVYLAGVVCGGYKTTKWFIENSRIHAEMIVENLINKLGN
ncbi:MAG: YpdA family putative bacillithiol disulfide reductase [Chitinophagales bacterium]